LEEAFASISCDIGFFGKDIDVVAYLDIKIWEVFEVFTCTKACVKVKESIVSAYHGL